MGYGGAVRAGRPQDCRQDAGATRARSHNQGMWHGKRGLAGRRRSIDPTLSRFESVG